MLFNDGPHFLNAAQALAAGRVGDALAQPQHPLYPALVAFVHALGAGWENAAALVSVLGGTAAIGFAALFFRDAFDARVAWLAAGLLVFQARAVEASSDVQSDGLYAGLFLAGVWLAWRAFDRRSMASAAFCGVAAGLAYLTRPEGLGIAIVAAGLAAANVVTGRATVREALRIAAAISLCAAFFAAPYAIAISRGADSFALTHKKSLRELAGVAADPAPAAAAPQQARARLVPLRDLVPPEPDRGEDGRAVMRAGTSGRRAFEATRMVARTEKSALRYGPLVLLAIGLWVARGTPGRRGVFVLSIAALYTVVLWVLAYRVGYVSRRHALPPLAPLLGYAGLGAAAIGAWLARASGRERIAHAAAIALVGAVAAGEIVGQLEPRRAEERSARIAAEWLRSNAPAGPVVTDRLRLGYYAGMPYVPFVRADDAALRAFFTEAFDPARGKDGARYVLLDDPEDVAAARRAAGDRMRVLHRVGQGKHEAWVFERTDPPPP